MATFEHQHSVSQVNAHMLFLLTDGHVIIVWHHPFHAPRARRYGTGVNGGPGTPLLGVYDTEDECEHACSANANCTQYTWAAREVCQVQNGHWSCDETFAKHCYGRCDTPTLFARMQWKAAFIQSPPPPLPPHAHTHTHCLIATVLYPLPQLPTHIALSFSRVYTL
jgi:hypothetical protein